MEASIKIQRTIHNTEESFQLVQESIPEHSPDVVAVELPPEYFDDGPEWSLSSALNPATDVSIPGFVLHNFAIEGDIWQVDEMELAARIAVENGADVALIDQPFAKSMDAIARGLLTDLTSTLKSLQTEIQTHQELASDDEWKELLQRDLLKTGEKAGPLAHYITALRRHGVTDITDSTEREAAMDDFNREELNTYFDVIRTVAPNWVSAVLGDRDANMAGHLRYLYDEGNSVLAFVGSGHVTEIKRCLEQENKLDESLIRAPEFADAEEIPKKEELNSMIDYSL